MTAQNILDVIRRLDIEQGQVWDRYYTQADDPTFEMSPSELHDQIDLIDDERRKLVQWYKDQFGPLPDGVTEVY